MMVCKVCNRNLLFQGLIFRWTMLVFGGVLVEKFHRPIKNSKESDFNETFKVIFGKMKMDFFVEFEEQYPPGN